MKLVAHNRGYTILEVLIFLAISGFILVSALVVVNGRQEQVQYQQAVREIDSSIRAAVSDVSNGFFPRTDFSCSNDAGSLVIASNGSAQGSRQDCVFAGKAIVPGENQITYTTIAGLRPSLGQASNINDADLTPVTGTPVNLDNILTNPWGLRLVSFTDQNGDDLTYIAYISSFGSQSQSGQLDSGTQSVSLYKSTEPIVDMDIEPVLGDDRIYLCFESSNGNRKAAIIIGEGGRQLSTSVDQDAEGKYEEQCGF